VIRLLVVDDSALMRKLLGKIFQSQEDFEVQYARNGLEALDLLAHFQPNVVTLDIHMPQMDGLTCLDRIMVEQPCPVVMVSSLTVEGAEATLRALRLGAVDFVAKPEGAISLQMDDLAAELVRKVRTAAAARIRASSRLRERIRHHLRVDDSGLPQQSRRERAPASATAAKPRRASGEGLVLVGTSTGGPPALEAVLTRLPAGFPWPILIAQHMPASFTGALARRLDKQCALTVLEAARPVRLEPGYAYIGKGDADIVVARRASGLVAEPVTAKPNYPWHPSTDRLVKSAMDHIPAGQLIGVLLTGMGNDGAQAMATLRAAGGHTIAEAEETAVVWGMPGELVAAGGADWVLPLHEVAPWLQRLVP
jgi:two-component system chemotaxis response regulator CheB